MTTLINRLYHSINNVYRKRVNGRTSKRSKTQRSKSSTRGIQEYNKEYRRFDRSNEACVKLCTKGKKENNLSLSTFTLLFFLTIFITFTIVDEIKGISNYPQCYTPNENIEQCISFYKSNDYRIIEIFNKIWEYR